MNILDQATESGFRAGGVLTWTEAYDQWRTQHAERACGDLDGPGGCICTCEDHQCQDMANLRAYEFNCEDCRDRRYLVIRPLHPQSPAFGKSHPCPACNGPTAADRKEFARAQSRVSPTVRAHHTMDKLMAPGLNVARQWQSNRHKLPFLALTGSRGTGKTTTALALLDDAIESGIYGVYYTATELLDDLRSCFADGAVADLAQVERLPLHAGVLVLDDLDAENPTPWTRERLLRIVDYRWQHRKWTICTTNRSYLESDHRLWSRVFGTARAQVSSLGQTDHRYD
jgi:hypothetical protein